MRVAWPIAAGAALAALALVVALNVGRAAPATRAQQAAQLGAELRCPDCAGLSVAESGTRSAAAIRAEVASLLAEGRTPDEVKQHFVSRYGEWILLAPRSALVWLLPAVLIVLGVAALVWWLLRRRAVTPQPAPAPTEAALRAVRDEAEALDA